MTAVPPKRRAGDERFIDPYEMPDPNGCVTQAPPPGCSGRNLEPTDDPVASVDSVRRWITDLDRQIVSLLARRRRLGRRTPGTDGRDPGVGLDPAREAAVIRAAADRGARLGLDPESVRDVFRHIVALSGRAEVDE